VGTFKGLIRLLDPKDEKADASFDMKEILAPTQLYCRLYILRGLKLSPKDSNNQSDPYLIIKLGGERISTRDRYIKNTLDPDFYERFEIPCTIPGDSSLEIVCWDWDGIGDDLIGSTTIDIEDRWFSKEWRKLSLKPLERRTLRTKSSRRSQGKLELWVELMPPELAKKTPMWDIKPPPPEPYELRLIIWGVREITIKDLTTNQNDLFLTGALSTKGTKKQETDTHWRSKKGKGNFNWRMKWTIDLPAKPWPRLRMQVWDLDIFSPSDSICETVLTLKGICKRALKKKDRVKIYMKGKDRFYIENLRHPNFKGNQGRVEISLELMPLTMATQLPAGLGRSDPNLNPFLPPPEGRVNWSLLHPFDMLKEILGPELYRKMCMGCCCMLFVAACVFMGPMIVSNVISNILTP